MAPAAGEEGDIERLRAVVLDDRVLRRALARRAARGLATSSAFKVSVDRERRALQHVVRALPALVLGHAR
jgi:hypothetical protein